MTHRRTRRSALLGRLLLGLLALAAATTGGAQVAPPGVTATVALDRTAYRFGVDPIKLAVTVQNVSGAPVFASQGFSQLPLALLLTFTGPDGQPIVATQQTLGTASNAGFPPVAFVGDQTVILDPVETLAPDSVRSATAEDARELYLLPQPGFYTVRVGVPIRTYAAIYQTLNGVDHAQLETATFAGSVGSGTMTFALFTDADGDGYTSPVPDPAVPGQTQADCNDADPAIHPGAVENPATAADDDCDPATTGDATSPVTTATVAPPPNANGWHQTDATVTLSATDAGSGVQALSYTLTGASSGGAVVVGATTTILITAEGVTTVTFFATDHAGNQEAPPRTQVVRIDKTAPTLNVPANFSVNATSPAGAIVTYTATATDNLDPSPQVSCAPSSGGTFPIGTTTVTCTATDQAGNSTTKSFTVTVKDAVTQIDDLIGKVQGLSIDAKTKNNWISQLQAAKDLVNNGNIKGACGKLKDLIKSVSSQSGKKLTKQQADDLIADATRIQAVLGCP